MKKEKAIIFGASKLGKIANEILSQKYNIIYFCDNDKSKWNKNFCRKKILSINELINYKHYKIIIASMYSTEISMQLIELEFKNIVTFRYYDNTLKEPFDGRYEIDKVYGKEKYSSVTINKKSQKIYINDFAKIYVNSKKRNIDDTTNIIYDKKNVLFISHFFPPIGGTVVQRSLKFCKYLKRYGWNPIVITTNDFYKFFCDYTLLNEIKYDISIIKIGNSKMNIENFDAESVQEITNLYLGIVGYDTTREWLEKVKKGNLNLIEIYSKMHGQIYWTNSVLKNIEKYIDLRKIDLIYTTASPFSSLIIGYYLKRKYNIPWVSDMRDEWTNEPFTEYDDKFKYKFEKSLESELIKDADKLINVSKMAANNYLNHFEIEKSKLEVITNGYDEEDFKNINIKKNYRNNFVITHNGNFQNKRQPDTFLYAIHNLIDSNCIDRKNILINFNQINDNRIEKLINDLNLKDIVKFKGVMNHRESLKRCSQANLLLHIVGPGNEARRIYTGKIFEYLRLNKKILSLAPKGGLVDQLINETQRGVCIEYDDIQGIEKNILKFYSDWKQKNEIRFIVDEKISIYERSYLTKKLVHIFNNIT